MVISHRLFLITTQIFLLSLIIRPQSRKIVIVSNDPEMTFNVTRSEVRHICTTDNRETQISPRFALQ